MTVWTSDSSENRLHTAGTHANIFYLVLLRGIWRCWAMSRAWRWAGSVCATTTWPLKLAGGLTLPGLKDSAITVGLSRTNSTSSLIADYCVTSADQFRVSWTRVFKMTASSHWWTFLQHQTKDYFTDWPNSLLWLLTASNNTKMVIINRSACCQTDEGYGLPGITNYQSPCLYKLSSISTLDYFAHLYLQWFTSVYTHYIAYIYYQYS